ncbi:helix-turn-helix domain-containing protein [Paraburkholderia xenovorans]|nr:helix-turn-helix domain-containing protein [Paraburkholderia xenovorans]
MNGDRPHTISPLQRALFKDFLDDRALAEKLNISVKTPAQWRHLGKFSDELPFYKFGRCVRYRREDVEAFIEKMRVGGTGTGIAPMKVRQTSGTLLITTHPPSRRAMRLVAIFVSIPKLSGARPEGEQDPSNSCERRAQWPVNMRLHPFNKGFFNEREAMCERQRHGVGVDQ